MLSAEHARERTNLALENSKIQASTLARVIIAEILAVAQRNIRSTSTEGGSSASVAVTFGKALTSYEPLNEVDHATILEAARDAVISLYQHGYTVSQVTHSIHSSNFTVHW